MQSRATTLKLMTVATAVFTIFIANMLANVVRAQGVRITSSWFSIKVDADICINAARQAESNIGYANIFNSPYTAFGGTDNLTAAVRCDIPGEIVIIFGYAVAPTQSEQDNDQQRMMNELKKLLP